MITAQKLTISFVAATSLLLGACASTSHEYEHDDTEMGPRPSLEQIKISECSEARRNRIRCDLT